jgi:hypothetical protein
MLWNGKVIMTMAYIEVMSSICLERLRKNMKNLISAGGCGKK